MVKISIFLSSTMINSNGKRVFSWLKEALEGKGHNVFCVDPLEYPDLQVFKERYDKSEGRLETLKKVSEELTNSDAIILLVAEYNHSFTGALKNSLDTFRPEYRGKPFGIISYSTGGFGGVRAATQVRTIIPELGGITIPNTLPISKVKDVLDENGKLTDNSYQEKLDKFIEVLEYYADKLN
jgi:NAD(P)H-dependent FMN reductase